MLSVLHCVFCYSACVSLPIPAVSLEPPTHPSSVSIAACSVLDHTHSLLQINWDAASLVVFAVFVLVPKSNREINNSIPYAVLAFLQLWWLIH